MLKATPTVADCGDGKPLPTITGGKLTVDAGDTFRINTDETEPPRPSLALTVTGNVPDTDGTPLITPVVGAMPKPAGKPLAEKVSASAFASKKAPAVVVLNATPTVADCGDGIPPPTKVGGTLTDGAGNTFRIKNDCATPPRLSLAVTTMPYVLATAATPLIKPVVGLIDNPVGNPLAENVRASPFGSVNAPAVVVLNATPTVVDCGDGKPAPTTVGG